jgi:hypothetical protein
MGKIKVSILFLAVLSIAFFVFRSTVSTSAIAPIKQGNNLFIEKIKTEIEVIRTIPDNVLCQDCFDKVQYLIDDHWQNDRLGINKSDNDIWKENLSKQLYTAYIVKFCNQVFYKFERQDWDKNASELNFMRYELQQLQQSRMLDKTSVVGVKLGKIKGVFSKYDEINKFIGSCRNFTISETRIDSKFPFSYSQQMIAQSQLYLNSQMGNNYVNNCSSLHDELNSVPNYLFQAQASYLANKINFWTGTYKDYNSQKSYHEFVWSYINEEIEDLDNTLYNVSTFDAVKKTLKDKWNEEGSKAYDYF